MPRRGNELVVIFWRDIPAQVNARAGADKHQAILPRRFQRAIDDAAMVAGKKTANEYVGEWRRTSLSIAAGADGIQAAAEAEAQRLEDTFPRERLQLFVANGGWDPDTPHSDTARTEPGTGAATP
jgi:Virulence factor